MNGSYVGFMYSYQGAWQVTDYSTSEQARAGSYEGSDGNIWHTAILKFTIPAFDGVSQSVAFKLWVNRLGTEYPSDISLRYAICTSDANKASYLQTGDAVTDANQITSGTVNLTDVAAASGSATYQTITISTDVLTSGTYYLFLWSAGAPSEQDVLVIQSVNSQPADSITLVYGAAPEEPEEPEEPEPEPEETFCSASFRIGLAVGLGLDGWYKEDETDG